MRLLVSFLALFGSAFAANELPITGLAHTGFKVSDLEKARSYYSGVLGFREAFDLRDSSAAVTAAFFKINDDQYVEITPGLKPDEVIRFTHAAFSTSDVEKLHRMLEARGLAPAKIENGRDGNRSFRLRDPEQNELEFVQIMPGSLQTQARGKYLDGRISGHLYHAGLAITNLDAALAFYGDKLGFAEFWRGGPTDIYEKSVWFNMRTPGTRGDYVELMLHSGPQTRQQYGSMQHICLEVPDIQAGRKIALERGQYDAAKLEPRVGHNRKWQLNLFDPDGTRTELMEPNAQPQTR